MIRRPLLAAGALAAALLLSSCSTLSSNDEAASVGEVELSRDELGAMLESELGQTLLQDELVDGEISGASARTLISVWVQLTVLAEADLLADADLVGIESNLASTYDSWADSPQSMRDLAIRNQAVNALASEGVITRDLAAQAVADADIAVDSRYGYWDGETSSVVAFG